MAGLMKKTLLTLILGLGFCLQASADIWKWTDAKGDVHFVNTTTAIYTWVGNDGRVHFSDTPDHESAVLVNLVWHSTDDKTLSAAAEKPKTRMARAVPGESEAEKYERESAEAYYCKRAQEIYDSYLNAPRLYETTEKGERKYLSDKEATSMLSDTKFKVDSLCN